MKFTRGQLAVLEYLMKNYLKALERRLRLKLTTLEKCQALSEVREAEALLGILMAETERRA